jgi:hypothetical protein
MAITFLTAAQAADSNPVVGIHSAGEVHVSEGEYDLAAALIDDVIVKLCKIPPGCIPIDCRLMMDDLDSGTPALVGSLMLMKPGAAAATVASELIKDTALGQAGGIARMDKLTAAIAAVVEAAPAYEQLVVFHVTTAPGTGAATGRIKVSVLFRAKEPTD